MKNDYTSKQISDLIEGKLLRYFGREPGNATKQQFYKAACLVVRDIMAEMWLDHYDRADSKKLKQVYYLSMEFLPGQSLRNNTFNLDLEPVLRKALSNFGRDIEELYEMDPDAGLGNGGLGRLASCYLDAIATQGMVGNGCSICYEYGIFKQRIENGEQKEEADDWMDLGDVWLIAKEDEKEEIHLGGKLEEIWDNGKMKIIHRDYTRIIGIPSDMLISGYHSEAVNSLRLWTATSPVNIDMELFAEGRYLKAMSEKHMAEVISKILYPEDKHEEGKRLRLSQQYFFIAASMMGIARRHMKKFGTLDNFSDEIAIHINDTHPTMAIPELLRIFMDEYGYEWDRAMEIVKKTVSYTNHTVMPEALEKWPEDIFKELLPRIHSIIKEISRRQERSLQEEYPQDATLRGEMAIIYNGEIRMANLCVAVAHTVNGVSSLHSGIIKSDLFGGFANMDPDKFTNVTNGIAYRRWLCQANPKLTAFIGELCGDGFKKDARDLEKLMAYQGDKQVLDRLAAIKRENKVRLSNYIARANNLHVDPDSIFDVQVKRLHEYKRQLLNLFHIMHLYNQLKENPNMDIQPQTFIFGAKAAAGYYMAKQIISLACHLSKQLETDPAVGGRIRIVFLENYSVSLSELVMPAAEVSEQISLAGKEASGTGNMKLMINGAVTLGTMDGANVEIFHAVGEENIFIFGMRVAEVERILKEGSYHPWDYCHNNGDINKILGMISGGIDGVVFRDVMNAITTGGASGHADPYFVLADFEAYRQAQKDVVGAYGDRDRWNRMSLVNIAKAGIFSADRAVKEYAERIWHIKPVE